MASAAAARKTKPSKSAPVRRDPRHKRHVDGTSPWMRLVNERPDRKYVCANKADMMYGVPYYEAIGYQVELVGDPKDKFALRFAAGRTGQPGEPLENFGHVVMSIDLARWEEIEREGITGGDGQRGADAIERRIVNKRGGYDPLRGIHGAGDYLGLKKEIRRPELEVPEEEPEDEGDDPLDENEEDPLAGP